MSLAVTSAPLFFITFKDNVTIGIKLLIVAVLRNRSGRHRFESLEAI